MKPGLDGAGSLVLTALTRPRQLLEESPSRWDELLVRARNTRLLGTIGAELAALELLDRIPAKAAVSIRAELTIAKENARMVRFEVNRISRALRRVAAPVVLLKGAAYELSQLPPAAGRLSSDVDIMVPKETIADVERALLADGYEAVKLDPYDQRYYRRWMHELPPLRHRERQTMIDVHHTILPETGRLRPDPAALLRAARPLADRLLVFAPTDMVLHSAAHLFQDGDLDGGLRDIVDLDRLLRHFGAERDFWNDLVPRARELSLERPLYYALRSCRGLLDCPVPEPVLQQARAAEPPHLARALMDRLIRLAVTPDGWDGPSGATRRARFLLYVRSHWLRMPPLLLARHLVRKAIVRTASPE